MVTRSYKISAGMLLIFTGCLVMWAPWMINSAIQRAALSDAMAPLQYIHAGALWIVGIGLLVSLFVERITRTVYSATLILGFIWALLALSLALQHGTNVEPVLLWLFFCSAQARATLQYELDTESAERAKLLADRVEHIEPR